MALTPPIRLLSEMGGDGAVVRGEVTEVHLRATQRAVQAEKIKSALRIHKQPQTGASGVSMALNN